MDKLLQLEAKLAYLEAERARLLARLAALDDPLSGRAAPVHQVEPFLDAVLERMGHAFSGHTLEVARTLVHLALEVGLRRGYHPFTSEVVFHLPQGGLALVLGLEAEEVQRALDRLQEAGLLAMATRRDGTIFRVRLNPGRAAPIAPWQGQEGRLPLERLIGWALPPVFIDSGGR